MILTSTTCWDGLKPMFRYISSSNRNQNNRSLHQTLCATCDAKQNVQIIVDIWPDVFCIIMVHKTKKGQIPQFPLKEKQCLPIEHGTPQYGTKSSRAVMTVTNIEDKFKRFNQNVCFWYQIQIWTYHSAANRTEKMIAVIKLPQVSWNHSKYRNEYIPR